MASGSHPDRPASLVLGGLQARSQWNQRQLMEDTPEHFTRAGCSKQDNMKVDQSRLATLRKCVAEKEGRRFRRQERDISATGTVEYLKMVEKDRVRKSPLLSNFRDEVGMGAGI